MLLVFLLLLLLSRLQKNNEAEKKQLQQQWQTKLNIQSVILCMVKEIRNKKKRIKE